jgi:hypothetical protein
MTIFSLLHRQMEDELDGQARERLPEKTRLALIGRFREDIRGFLAQTLLTHVEATMLTTVLDEEERNISVPLP